MATKTTNYNLTKPAYDEDADIAVINKNMDIIDTKMKEIEDAGGSGSGSSVEWKQITTSGTKIAEVTIDGNKTNVYAPNSSGGGSSSHNYSTEEQIVGTWVDGKPIYEKTLIFENQYLANGFTDLAHGISDIDIYIDLKGNYKNLENSNLLLLSHLNVNSLGVSIGAWCDNTTKIRILAGSDMAGNYNIYLTVQYTKTTG